MSRNYSLSRVQDALDAADGNHSEAQRIIMNWLERDQSLMVGLVAPHLKSIVSHAIDYVANKSTKPGQKTEGEPPAKNSALSDPVPEGDATGANVLETLLGQSQYKGGPQFGNFDEPATKPGRASQGHIDAIRKIAGDDDQKE